MTRHEQLSTFVMRKHGRSLSPSEIARPWTYLHREWVNDDGDRCSECVAVSILRDDGSKFRINVADMDAAAQVA